MSPTIGSTCTTALPVQYHVSSTSSNAVRQWVLDPKNYECHPHSMGEVPGGTDHVSLDQVSFTITAKQCLLVLVRLDYCASDNYTVTLTASLKQDDTVIQTCMHDFTIKRA
jgi:hypothetical protein